MIHAIRLARFQYPSYNYMMQRNQQLHHSCNAWAAQTATAARVTIASTTTDQSAENKDHHHHHDPLHKTPSGDSMAQSFGVEYATRSTEEGFGGIYGGNDDDEPHPSTTDLDNNQQALHHRHHSHIKQEYDKTQENEVKEQEKAMHEPDKMAAS